MHLKVIFKILSILILIIDIFLLICSAIAWSYNDWVSVRAFFYSALFSGCISFGILYVFRKDKKNVLSVRDGFLFVTLSWLVASSVGALPFVFSGYIPTISDAFFETMSGFTTTGATILTDIERMSEAMLFWRALTHWLGGMGIVVLAVAILPLMGIGGMQLMQAEAPGPTVDKITPRITVTAKYLWFIYVGFTAIETFLLMLGGMSLFDALTHSFATLATGGFSTKNLSVMHYNSAYIDWVITIFMVAAGMNFTLHFRMLTGNVKGLLKNTELKAYLVIFASASVFIAVILNGKIYHGFWESLRFASFQAASILTTTGFATADYELWPYFAQVILFMLMFVGGCAGSTGGGIKVIRIVTLLKQGLNEMKYLVHPRGIFTLRLSGHPVRKNIVYAISGFFFFYMFTLLTVTMLVASCGTDLFTSLTTALATVGNIGPGFGLVGPTENYAFYPDYVKWVLSIAMLIGRLEIYTVLVLLTPMFWKR
jgi:trk system potassium uptake protein TrkH